MEFFENLFKREKQEQDNEAEKVSQSENESEDFNLDFNEEIELKSQLDEENEFNDKYIRNLLKRSDINLADYKVYDKVKNLYLNILSDAVQNVNKITFHRKGNKVTESDMYLMENLKNENMTGGSYIGYCDSNPGQCMDVITSGQCGGDAKAYCDGHPSQCGDAGQRGGFVSFCDGHPSQCGDAGQSGGFYIIKGGNISNKTRGVVNKRDFEDLANKESKYQFSKKASKKLQQFVEKEVIEYLNEQKENPVNNKIFRDIE